MAPRRRVALEHASEEECGSDDRPCWPPSRLPPSPASASAPSPAAVVVATTAAAVAPSLALPLPETPIQIDDKSHKLTSVVIIVASALAACFLLLTYFTVLRYRSSRRRRRQAASLAAAFAGPPQPPPGADDDELRADLLVGAGGEDPYHVWYIRTVGLDEPTIGSISVCSYKRGEGLVEGTDCAVCLGEFADGELLRLLPKCSHAFHIPCIDTWLRSHVNCPLCRAPILAPSCPSPSPPFAADASATADVSAAADPSDVVAAAVVNSLGAQEEGSEEEAASAPLPPPHFAVDHPSPGSSFSSEESEIWVPIDLGNGGLGVDAAPVAPPEEPQGDVELQPAPRSVSMDSSALGGLLLRMRLAGSSADGRRKPSTGDDPSTTKKMGAEEGCCKGSSLAEGPLEMERSMSGGRFFLSRFSGRPRCAILPL